MSGNALSSDTEEVPMDVDSPDDNTSNDSGTKNTFTASGTSTTANGDSLRVNELKAEMAGAAARPEGLSPKEDLSTAEESWVTVKVVVDWPETIPKNKQSIELRKAVQSLLNKQKIVESECHSEVEMNKDFAVVQVKPPSVVDQLYQEKDLTFKSFSTTANVRFSPAPSAPLAPTKDPITDRLQNAHALQRSFSAGAVKEYEKDLVSRHNGMAPNTSYESTAFTQGDMQVEEDTLIVPLFQYWHITTAFSKEINQIERSNGAKIEGQALVSIKTPVHKAGKDSVLSAKDEFTTLFQMCAQDISVLSVAITSLDQGKVVEMLREIQRDESRLVLNMSSKSCQISGPKDSLDEFQRRWRLPSYPQDSEAALNERSTLHMDLQDPLEKQGLIMDAIHWDFISKVFEKQVTSIQQKFGVEFVAVPAGGEVNVKALLNGDQRFPLTCHALRALEQLYQKASTNMLACPLENPNHSKARQIESAFEKIHNRYPYVAAGDTNGPWRLVGLAEHLLPAVDEVEGQLGEPVFSKEAKLQLRNPKYSPTVSQGATASQAGDAEEDTCPICMDSFKDKTNLKCKHEFCRECLRLSKESLGPCCPICKDVFGKMEGTQPDGTMKWKRVESQLPGYPNCGTIEIHYVIPSGLQTKKHPSPGKLFTGAQRMAYLPDNKEGNVVLKLLMRAFDQKLIFTVGTSTTTGASDSVTWNDIHHKTSIHGGPHGFGYPDPDYLKRVKEELKAKGIE